MILVTVGTEKFPFNRLMQWIESAIELQIIREKVVVQAGSSTYIPKGAEVHQILPQTQFKELVSSARIVISHCGEGSFLLLNQLKVPFILVPRSVTFNEHVDDHQIEMAKALESLGFAVAYSPSQLVKLLSKSELLMTTNIQENFSVNLCRILSSKFPDKDI